MVCCAWNLNIFNNETSFYEAKKQQKCHDILRMSHCILWCHFHCIWWINKWWKKNVNVILWFGFCPKTFSTKNLAEDDEQSSLAGVCEWQHVRSAQSNLKKQILGNRTHIRIWKSSHVLQPLESVAINSVTVNTHPWLKSMEGTVIHLLSC